MKRSSNKEESPNKSAKREKEISTRNTHKYSFKNSYREFSTSTGYQQHHAISLNTTNQLLAVYVVYRTTINIYTTDGYLVTIFKVVGDTFLSMYKSFIGLHFSDHMIVYSCVNSSSDGLIRINDYNIRHVQLLELGCIECDGNNIYLANKTYLHDTSIDILSHDVEFIRKFEAYSGYPIAIKVRGDDMIMLDAISLVRKIANKFRLIDKRLIQILEYSLSSEQLIRTIKLNTEAMPFPTYLCFDQFHNLLIGNDSSKEFAILYRGGRISYRKMNQKDPIVRFAGLEVTDKLELIRLEKYTGRIRIYKSK
ncbi:hypothetical protein LOD99_7730 [Oopsacas minuta]|uniref:Uncharacterized protein n=1 Tax=Oopsacas minuta TaxID=111878 RepID=A0AAV7JQE4_9METZ|nr:hypothetical protein LOD99_7730 [Oopsacas minuta]